MSENTDLYLKPTFFMDSDHEIVKNFVSDHLSKSMTLTEKAVTLFYAIRDEIYYSPYDIDFSKNGMKASTIIKRKKGYCVAKAVVLCACLKKAGIPSRIGLADVKNHLTTKRLREVMGTDTFYYHGYTELYLNNKWIKVTPTFNKELCDKFMVKAIEFDGKNNSLFHEYDEKGKKHMTYLKDFGHYDELPFEEIKERSLKKYTNLFGNGNKTISGDFGEEARQDRG